jgi:hypothetical protein
MDPVFRQVFAGPAAFWDPEADHRVLTEPELVGSLPIPTGRLAIHDPGYEFAPEPLDRGVPPGSYALDLALRSWTTDDGTLEPRAMTAAARLSFAAATVERYVPVRSSDGARELTFGVDSVLIAVFDRVLLPALGSTAILDRLPDDVPRRAPSDLAAEITSLGDAALFVCQAGMGDGAYRAWWGLTAAGEVAELVVDFGLLEYSTWRTVTFPAAALLGSAARLRLAIAGSGLELSPVDARSVDLPIPAGWYTDPIAFSRPAAPTWEIALLGADGEWVGGPGRGQYERGPWFEIFDRALVERAETVRVRIHEGNRPLEPAAPGD